MADSPLVDGGSVRIFLFWHLTLVSNLPPSFFPGLPHPHLTQGRLVKEAGDMHLYSSIFSVMGEDKEVKKGALKEKKETSGRNGEILALLPHFLSFTSLTNTGSFQITISIEIYTKSNQNYEETPFQKLTA